MNISKHPAYKAIYDLCLEIEKLPGSEQQTKVVILARDLEKHVDALLEGSPDTPSPVAQSPNFGQLVYDTYYNNTPWKGMATPWKLLHPAMQGSWEAAAYALQDYLDKNRYNVPSPSISEPKTDPPDWDGAVKLLTDVSQLISSWRRKFDHNLTPWERDVLIQLSATLGDCVSRSSNPLRETSPNPAPQTLKTVLGVSSQTDYQ